MTQAKRASRFEIDGDGQFEAVICTFNVRDHDGDVVVPGAITNDAACAISTWNHGSWQTGQPPVGRGRLRSTKTEAIVAGQFFMNTQAGAETFAAVKALHEVGIGEWSWSLHDVVGREGRMDGRTVRYIDKVRVRECSPVMRAASIGTRTLSAKELAVIDAARAHITAQATADTAKRQELARIRDETMYRFELERARRNLAALRGPGR
jgi:hypothetical protein